MYQILGDVIDGIYQNNIGVDASLPDTELLKRILSFEQALNAWRSQLPAELEVRSTDGIIQCLNTSSLFSELSTVITLRYLMTRLLLHRPVVARFLDRKNEQGGFEISEILELFGEPSLKLGVRSASEMIDIVFALSEHPHLMLTTWWFSIYYCELPCIPLVIVPYEMTDLATVFSASLVVFSAMILKQQHSTLLFCREHLELSNALLKAEKALERIGNGTRMVARCLKHLRKLTQFVETFGMFEKPLECPPSLYFDLTNASF